MVYAVSAVDKSGRVADRRIVQAVGWAAGARLDVRVRDGVIVARYARDGVCRVDDRGYFVVPLSVRRWCNLSAGARLLLAAVPAGGLLCAYPPDVLGRLLGGASAVAGGEDW